MKNEGKKNYELLKKWMPVVGIVVLTAALMIYFKATNVGYISIQNVGRDLVAEYTQNLKPVYSRTELTKEDLVNFALYKNLPVDKENNTVLQIKSDEMGRENYIVKSAAINPKTNNYERFGKKFHLTEDEIAIFDSILNAYNDNLYAAVLYNDNNTLAVDPNLHILQKAMSTDIYKFLKVRVHEKTNVELPENYATLNRDKIHEILDANRERPEKEFIFITPDTVFQHNYNTDFNEYLAAVPESDPEDLSGPAADPIADDQGLDILEPTEINPPIIKIDSEGLAGNYTHYNIDSNYYVVEIPDEYYTAEGLPDFDSLRISLDNLEMDLNSFSMNFNFDEEGTFEMDISDFTNEDSLRTFNLEFNLKNLTSFISETIDAADEYDDNDWEEFGMKIDSLARSMEIVTIDSLKLIRIKEHADSLKQAGDRRKNNH
jgi:hypothetical protein